MRQRTGRLIAAAALACGAIATAPAHAAPAGSEPEAAPAAGESEAPASTESEAERLLRLAILMHERGDYPRALRLYERALAGLASSRASDDPLLDLARNNLAVLHTDRGDFEAAERLHRETLARREARLGAQHPQVASTLLNLALLTMRKGAFEEAEAHAQRALAMRREASPGSAELASTLNLLGSLALELGAYGEAEGHYRESLAIREALHGPEHAEVAEAINNLAGLQQHRAEYAQAEALFQRALAILEKTLGPGHPHVATALNNLGFLYAEKGEHVRAARHHRRALALREERLGKSHPQVGRSLANLGTLHREQGDLELAEPLYRRALAIFEAALGPDHPDTAQAIANLAAVHQGRGELEPARDLYGYAIATLEKALGSAHPDVAALRNNLAEAHRFGQEWDAAEALYQQALAGYETALGPEHPQTALVHFNLALVHWGRGDVARAIETLRRGNAIHDRNLAAVLATGSDSQRLAYAATLAEDTDATVSLQLRGAPRSPQALALALETVLRRKGRVLDALSESLSALRRRLAPADRTLLDELASVRSRLGAAVLRGPRGLAPERYRARVATLAREADALQARVASRSAAFARESREVTLAEVQRAIPEDALLVEWLAYRPFDPLARRDADVRGAPRYAAWMIARTGPPAAFDLGAAAPIDADVERLRRALSDLRVPRAARRRLARQLEERLLAPVRAAHPEVRHLLLSPDGALHLLPFGTLVDAEGRLLVERYTFTYLSSGRDLLRLAEKTPPRTPPAILADPDFDRAAASEEGGIAATRSAARSALVDARFERLPGAAAEAKALVASLPGARLALGPEASETLLKSLTGPRVLHVATHGFFLRSARVAHPLLRSGLALAGANDGGAGGEDGVLSALEASGLDLRGTQLVVLSACETGVGEIESGEGVYGLRRALVVAGAESQVISLWKVPDEATRALMIGFYRRLAAGEPRSQALRAAQLELRETEPHPFHWAAFIPSGDWRPLATGTAPPGS